MINPNELAVTAAAFAVAIAECKTTEEIAVLSAFFVQVGDTLATIAAQQDFIDSQNKSKCE